MIENKDIAPGAVTEPKLSKNLRIKLTNLEKGASAQLPIVQSDGSMAYKAIGGDATLADDGTLTVTTSTTTTGETVQGPAGPAGAAGPTGATGAQGATGPAGSDANVTAENVDGALGFTASTQGLVKRNGDNSFVLDTSTYSTTDHDHILSDITDSGTAAALDVPAAGNAASGEVVKGNDSRLSDTRTPSSTLAHKASHETGGSDALSPSDIGAEPSFTKNTAHNKDFGTAAGTVCQGNDSRLSDSRTPTSHTHTLSDVTDSGGAAALDVGTSTGTVCAGDDSRLSDARTPTSHNHSGSDITSGTIDTDRLDVGASSGKVAAGDHTHSSYITGNETITLSGNVTGSGTTAITCTVANDSHTHSTATLTGLGGAAEKDVGTGSGDVAQGNHTHDGRYYQESEFINASAGAGDAGKPVKLDAGGHIDSTMLDVGASSGQIAAGDHTHSQYSTFDIDDSSALTTDVWSASKIISYLATFYATLSNGFTNHKYTATVTGDASETKIFYVTHNLGTYHVVVSVRHPIITGSSATTIDEMFDAQQYTMMDVGHSSAPGVEVATINSSGNACNNCIALRFPEAPEDGDEYLVTVIG